MVVGNGVALGRRRISAGMVCFAIVILAVFWAASPVHAATTVVGASNANVPLVVSPDSDPQISSEDVNVYVGTVAYFIQKLPATRTVRSITMGDFRSNDACDGQTLPLMVLEADGGEYASWHAVAESDAHLGVHMGPVTWTIPATVFRAGRGYAFLLESGDFAPCSTIESRTWAHNSEIVNAGPGSCTSFFNWTPYEPTRRYWHVKGQDDVDDSCALGFDLKPSNFDASMPTGWLSVYKPSYSGPVVNTSTSSSQRCPTSSPDNSGQAVDWPEQPATKVCEYPQFGSPGQELDDGWYYGIAANYWNGGNNYYSTVRDRSLRLAETADGGGGGTTTGAGAPSPSDLAGDSNPGAPNLADGKFVSADPIDAGTGNLVEHVTDVTVGGRGVPLAFDRTYNSMFAADPGNNSGHLGAGWAAAWSTYLRPPTATDPTAVVHNDNGSTVPFVKKSDGSFDSPGFVTASLKATSNGYVYSLRDGTGYAFDGNGRLISVTDHNGYATTLAYNGAGQLTQVTNEHGRSLSMAYNTDGRLHEVADPSGRKATYDYDSSGNLTSATDVAGGVTHYGYDAAHHLTSLTDQNGHTLSTTYDDQGRASSQTDAENETTRLSYTTNQTDITDPRGVKQRLQFAYGLITSETDALGAPEQRTLAFKYDSAFNRIERDDALGHAHTWTYNNRGDRLTSTDELGHTTTNTYTGDSTSKRDPSGRVRRFARDSAGDLTSVTDGEGNTTSSTYDDTGWRTSITSPRGNVAGATPSDYTTRYTRDPFGRVTQIKDHLSRTATIAYDAVGNRTSSTDTGGHKTTFAYDKVNRLVKTTRADTTHTDQAYDNNGNALTTADGLGHSYHYTYDALNRLETITDPLGHQTKNGYDAADRQRTMRDANGETTSDGYDDAGHLTSVNYSNSATHSLTFAYDADGHRTDVTDAIGHSTFSYDSLGRLKTTLTPGPVGRLAPTLVDAGFVDEQEQVDYGYDLAGRITQIQYPNNLPSGASVSGTDALISAYARPTVKRRYDDAGRLVEVDDFKNRRFLFTYDPDSQLTSTTKPNATTTAQTYDRAGQLTRIKTTGPNGTLLDLPYTNNDTGLISSTSATAALNQQAETYSYDNLNQVIDAKLPTAVGTDVTREHFAYDAGDRTTTLGVPGANVALSYDDADQLTRAVEPTTNTQLATFTYDADGRRTAQTDVAGAQVTYGYDQSGQMTRYRDRISTTIGSIGAHAAASMTSTTPADTTYRYNGNGLRADLLWDYSQPTPLVLEDPKHLYITGPDGLPLEQVDLSGTALYYDHDAIGSTRLLTQQDGHPTVYSDYDTYGRPIKNVNATLNPFGYAGQYTDPTTGLIYMRARWYDPRTGQFLTRDPLGLAGGDQNPYGYTNRDPVNLIDPSGLLSSRAYWNLGAYFDAEAAITLATTGTYLAYTAFTSIEGAAAAIVGVEGVLVASLSAVPFYAGYRDLKEAWGHEARHKCGAS